MRICDVFKRSKYIPVPVKILPVRISDGQRRVEKTEVAGIHHIAVKTERIGVKRVSEGPTEDEGIRKPGLSDRMNELRTSAPLTVDRPVQRRQRYTEHENGHCRPHASDEPPDCPVSGLKTAGAAKERAEFFNTPDRKDDEATRRLVKKPRPKAIGMKPVQENRQYQAGDPGQQQPVPPVTCARGEQQRSRQERWYWPKKHMSIEQVQ